MRSLVAHLFLMYTAVEIIECVSRPRIIGGEATNITKIPYQVSLQYLEKHVCGGSIISDEWILTGAHCVFRMDESKYRVRAGSSYHNKEGTLHNATTIIHHHKYHPVSFDYDIAVIRISPSLDLDSPNVGVIKLAAEENLVTPGTKLLVSGWGFHYMFGVYKTKPEQVRAVMVPYMTREKCREYVVVNPLTARMICAGAIFSGKNSCEGDSGGPLVGKGVQIGIVSWGVRCALPSFPSVYTNVANLREWVLNSCGV